MYRTLRGVSGAKPRVGFWNVARALILVQSSLVAIGLLAPARVLAAVKVSAWEVELAHLPGEPMSEPSEMEGKLALVATRGGLTGSLEIDDVEYALTNVRGDLGEGPVTFEVSVPSPAGMQVMSYSFSGHVDPSKSLKGQLVAPATMGYETRFNVAGSPLLEVTIWLCGNHKPKDAALTEDQRKKLSKERGCKNWSSH